MITTHMRGVLEEISVNKIHMSKRALRNPNTQIEYLKESIREKGILQPIIVRPDDGGYEIVAGNRRLMALKALGYRVVPAHVVELSDQEAFEVALIENIQRKTLNPIEEAKAYKLYIDKMGWGGITKLSKRIGKSQECISRKLQLLRFPPPLQSEIAQGIIKPSMATELATLLIKDEDDVVQLIMHGEHISRSEIRRIGRRTQIVESQNDGLYISPRQYSEGSPVTTLKKACTILRIAMLRIDSLLENTPQGSNVYTAISRDRRALHEMIDSLVRLKSTQTRELNGRAS